MTWPEKKTLTKNSNSYFNCPIKSREVTHPTVDLSLQSAVASAENESFRDLIHVLIPPSGLGMECKLAFQGQYRCHINYSEGSDPAR